MEMTPEELEARKAKIEAFLKEYAEVSRKHLLDFRSKLVFDQTGIVPRMEVIDVVVEEPKA